MTSQNIVLSSWDTLYKTRLASNEIQREVGRAKDLSALLYIIITSALGSCFAFEKAPFWDGNNELFGNIS
jgi:hypothetical protein